MLSCFFQRRSNAAKDAIGQVRRQFPRRILLQLLMDEGPRCFDCLLSTFAAEPGAAGTICDKRA